MELKNKKVTIIGAARSGIAAATLVQQLGGRPKITDAKPLAAIEQALAEVGDRSLIDIESGGHTRGFVTDSDLVVASPGVKRDAEPVRWAQEAGIPVWSEIELAWRYCKKPVIAVTGSNGKTTTVTLIARVLEAGGRKVCLCGNVGTPFSRFVLSQDTPDYFVVEISSFQLELVETFRPRVAVLLNFSQNHLDRHADMQEYFDAKKRICMNQTPEDFVVLNARDEMVCRLAGEVRSQVRLFNREGETRNPDHLAVLEVARIVGVPDEVTLRVFETFPGVEHRLEKVRLLNGVEYINDSKSTTVESGRWALSNVPGPIILLCGGHDKGMDYSVLRELVGKTVRKMIVLTREEVARQSLHQAFEGVVPLEDQSDMEAAVRSACAQARHGEKVLLSPMFASFDMFTNFEERGRVFKEIVNRL
ncbi:MAG: UDP-N-acetylmuramoyl-L-alanine--D-glutamate ligase [Candidatus Omnitrophica bacterium]|nr:UDP-N-acetylmuramoyl-L-alanine--D-glutamate ligase [Candidatus Omnitrophota bacterium]